MTTRYLGHDIERRPAVRELLVMDFLFAQVHEEDGSNTLWGIIKICKQYAGYMARVEVSYSRKYFGCWKEQSRDLSHTSNI